MSDNKLDIKVTSKSFDIESQTMLNSKINLESNIGNLTIGTKQWKKAIIKNCNYAVYGIKDRTNDEDINILTNLLVDYIKEFELSIKNEFTIEDMIDFATDQKNRNLDPSEETLDNWINYR